MRTLALAAAGAATLGVIYMVNQNKQPTVTAPGETGAATPQPQPQQPSNIPVGIANNNPFNMRDYGIAWQGNIGRDSRGLEVFDTIENGLRAAGNDIKNKWLKGIKTIRQLITEWAPPNGMAQDGTKYTNPTETYIKRVSQLAGIPENEELISERQYFEVAKAMIRFENGQNPYPDNLIKTWFFVGMRYGKPLPFYFEKDETYGLA